MPRIRDILPAVVSHRSAVIDQALSAALPHAEAQEVGPLAQAVLGRARPDRSVGLILEYDRVPPEFQHQVIERAEELTPAIRRAATRHGERGALNALRVIEAGAATPMAYLVTAMLRNSSKAVRLRASSCLLALSLRCSTCPEHRDLPHLSARQAKFLVEAVEQAVVMYANADRPALLRAMTHLLPRGMPEALAAMRNPEHPAVEPMRELLAKPADQANRSALLLLMSVHPVGPAARAGLIAANQQNRLADALHSGHLLSLPGVKRELKRERRPDSLWPDARQTRAMPTAAQRWLPAYLAAMPLDPQEQVLRLARLSKATAVQTRLAVLRRLLRLARQPRDGHTAAADNANDVIAAFTGDADVALARTALWHLMNIDYAGLPRILANLVNSRHPEVRAVAARRLAPLGFERYWQAWPKLDPDRRIAAGRALIKIDAEFHRHLGARLASRDPANRMRALGIIGALGQGAFFEQALIDLAGSSDARVVASAVRALGGCTSDTAHEVLSLALEHDDTRIRANAVEALASTDAAKHLDRLLAIAQHDVQRPRANAIRQLMELRTKDALPALNHMLHDPRAEHRVSALWLIDEMGLLQLARQVAELSVTDEDARVKERAAQVIQHLIDDLEHQVAEHKNATEAA